MYKKFNINQYSFIEFTEDYGEKCLLIGKIGDEKDKYSGCYKYQDPLILIKTETKTAKFVRFNNIFSIINYFTGIVRITSVQLSDEDPFSDAYFSNKFDPFNESYQDLVPYESRMWSILWTLLFGDEFCSSKSLKKVILDGEHYNFNTFEFETKIFMWNDLAQYDEFSEFNCEYQELNSILKHQKIWSISLKDRNENEHNLIWDNNCEYDEDPINKIVCINHHENLTESRCVVEEIKEEKYEAKSDIVKSRRTQDKKKVIRKKRNTWRRRNL